MQIYPLRIDIDLEICSRVPRIFLAGREFFSSVENIFTSRDFFGWSRMFFFFFSEINLIGECRGSPVSEITVTITTAIIIFLDKN